MKEPRSSKPSLEDIKRQRQEKDEKAAVHISKDSRFSAVLNDPRFGKGAGKKQKKVEIDERFAGMFTDEDFQVKAAVDKRGRKVSNWKQNKGEDLKKYYRLKDEDQWRVKDGEEADAEANKGKDEVKTSKSTDSKKEQKKKSNKKDVPSKKVEELLAREDMLFGSDDDDELQEVKPKAADKGKASKKGSKTAAAPESEDASESASEEDAGDDSDSGDGEGGSSGDMDDEARKRWARMRGLDEDQQGSDSSDGDEGEGEDEDASSESSYDSADELLTEEEEGDNEALDKAVQEWGVGAYAANPTEEPIPLVDQTRRLAVVDQDWEHTRAVDLFVGLSSFLPKGSQILKITVYPSDYGLQRMAQEAVSGPQGILKSVDKKKKKAADSDEEDVDEDEEEDEDEDDDGDEKEVDVKKVRMYEMSKLRYYYAVVECDTVATAAQLYRECDGMEFEHSACKMDLRFVPDEQSFEGRQVRDVATCIPADYKPPDVFTTSLQHTDPTLTWDQDDVRRKRVLQKKMTEDEIKEADFAAFLASSSEEEEEDDVPDLPGDNKPGAKQDPQAIRERYRALLLGLGGTKDKASKSSDKSKSKSKKKGKGTASSEDGDEDDDVDIASERVGGKSWLADDGSDSEGDDEDGGNAKSKKGKKAAREALEMEVTYVPGLEKLGKQLIENKKQKSAKESQTVWEAYLQRKKDKQKEKRRKKRGQDSSDDDDEDLEAMQGSKGKTSDNKAGADDFFKADDGGDDPFNDPFFNDPSAGVAIDSEDDADMGPSRGGVKGGKGEKKKGVKGGDEEVGKKPVDAKSAAELELLMMDDDELRHAALKGGDVTRATAGITNTANEPQIEARGKGKKARQAAKRDQKRAAAAALRDDDEAAEFEADLADPRFKSMFQDHEFALDPTDPRYKTLKDSKVAKELTKLKKQAPARTKAAAPTTNGHAADGVTGNEGQAEQQAQNTNDLKGMIAKLKRRSQQQQQPDNKGPANKKAKKF